MPLLRWCVRVVEPDLDFVGVAPEAAAKAPARKRHRTGTSCLAAGWRRIEFSIGPKTMCFNRRGFSLRKCYRPAQLERRTVFLNDTTGRRYRCAEAKNATKLDARSGAASYMPRYVASNYFRLTLVASLPACSALRRDCRLGRLLRSFGG